MSSQHTATVFIAPGSQECLDSLNRPMENNFRPEVLGRIGPKSNGGYWWKSRPQARERLRGGAWLGQRQGASTLGTKDSAKGQSVGSGVEALPEVGRSDAPSQPGRINVWGCRACAGSMAKLMRVIRYCIDRLALSWSSSLTNPQQKLAVLVDTDHASDETTRRACRATIFTWGRCLIETQSARQGTVVLSSGQSKF